MSQHRAGLMLSGLVLGLSRFATAGAQDCPEACTFPNPPYFLPLGVNLKLLPALQKDLLPGDIVSVSLWAQPTQSVPTLVAGIDAIIVWEEDKLELCGLWNNGPYPWIDSGFPDDGPGIILNFASIDSDCGPQPFNQVPQNDGDAFYRAIAHFPPPVGLGEAVLPSGSGLLVTTFLFRVGTVQPLDTTIEILPSLDVACSAVAWGQGGQCSNVPLPCNPLVPTFCPGGGTCIPLDHQPGCDILAELTGARVLGPCSVPCGDANGDGVSDDACIWWECETTNCMTIPRGYADLGGVEGICGPDGVCDGNDRYHALNCFSDLDTGGPGTHYPCEESPPSALNVDAASMRQPCVADGVCDGNDAFAALNCFSNMTTCSCNGPAPAHAAPPTPLGRTTLAARAAAPRVRPGETVSVDVYLEDGLDDLRGYQLHVHPAGGESGRLELVDIAVRPEMAPPFAGLGAWEAFNVNVGQMVAGLDAAGVPAAAGSYLATFTFRASKDAAGAFSIEILADAKDHSQRTVLFPTPADGWITVDSTTPAVVEVLPARSARLKARRGD